MLVAFLSFLLIISCFARSRACKDPRALRARAAREEGGLERRGAVAGSAVGRALRRDGRNRDAA